jgi:hypothetical protein
MVVNENGSVSFEHSGSLPFCFWFPFEPVALLKAAALILHTPK